LSRNHISKLGRDPRRRHFETTRVARRRVRDLRRNFPDGDTRVLATDGKKKSAPRAAAKDRASLEVGRTGKSHQTASPPPV
jgi:hypothetical protein